MSERKRFLPLREWLELGQVLNDANRLAPRRHFRKWHTQEICLGHGVKVKADGKIYREGKYYLAEAT